MSDTEVAVLNAGPGPVRWVGFDHFSPPGAETPPEPAPLCSFRTPSHRSQTLNTDPERTRFPSVHHTAVHGAWHRRQGSRLLKFSLSRSTGSIPSSSCLVSKGMGTTMLRCRVSHRLKGTARDFLFLPKCVGGSSLLLKWIHFFKESGAQPFEWGFISKRCPGLCNPGITTHTSPHADSETPIKSSTAYGAHVNSWVASNSSSCPQC